MSIESRFGVWTWSLEFGLVIWTCLTLHEYVGSAMHKFHGIRGMSSSENNPFPLFRGGEGIDENLDGSLGSPWQQAKQAIEGVDGKVNQRVATK